MGQICENEGDEHVVGIVRFLLGIDQFTGVLAKLAELRLVGQRRGPGGGFGLRITAVASIEPGLQILPLLVVGRLEFCLQRIKHLAIALRPAVLPRDLIEVHRRSGKLVKHEEQHPSIKMQNCIGILNTALNISPNRLSRSDAPAMYRCTCD